MMNVPRIINGNTVGKRAADVYANEVFRHGHPSPAFSSYKR